MYASASTIVTLVVVIVVMSLTAQFVVTDERFKRLLYVVSAVITFMTLLLWILQVLGVYHGAFFQKG